jgi:hypothetical protein
MMLFIVVSCEKTRHEGTVLVAVRTARSRRRRRAGPSERAAAGADRAS